MGRHKRKMWMAGMLIFGCAGMMSACGSKTLDEKIEKKQEVKQEAFDGQEAAEFTEIHNNQENSLEEQELSEQGENKKEIASEKKLPLDYSNYYEETGIWDFWIGLDGNPETLAVHDKTGKSMLLSWTEKKQKERKFPAKQKNFVMNQKLVPCSYENKKGYLSYNSNRLKIYDQDGNEKKEIDISTSLKAFEFMLHQELKDAETYEMKYEIQQCFQQEKDRLCFIVKTWKEKRQQAYPAYKKESLWDAFYLLEIDLKEQELVSKVKDKHWILGVDKEHVFSFDGKFSEDMFSESDFSDGTLWIRDRETGQVLKKLKIPDDREDDCGSIPSQQFSFQNGRLFFANRTGIYTLSRNKKKWKKLIDPKDTLYLNENNWIADFQARDKNCFYVLFVEGLEDESANLLVRYRLS